MGFNEILSHPRGNYRYAELYDRDGLEIIDNTEQEIMDVGMELINRARNTVSYSKEDEDLQKCFLALLKPGHYSIGSPARVGRDFLRKHRDLMNET